MDLFSHTESTTSYEREPLAVRMRPRTLADFIGQHEIVGQRRYLRRMIDSDNIPSCILYGPPGTGKTTLAEIIANQTRSYFEKLNAVSAGIADVRKVIDLAKSRLRQERKRTVLFIDEIHRFNKSQQDILLPYVENGIVTLIGATTENPFFSVNSPLLSRMRVLRFRKLESDEIVLLLKKALSDTAKGLGKKQLSCADDVLERIAEVASGDARTALNLLEECSMMVEADGAIESRYIDEVMGEKIQYYDKNGDNHYDVVSAFIKSMRGSDADAALHYLARMISAGEDLNFIARRIVICASEDVGNADPQALVVAMAAAQAAQFVGFPEARIPLAQAAVYIASAPKSNASYLGIDEALSDVRQRDYGTVPNHLRDSHYKGAKQFGYGEGYLYPHDYPQHYVNQQYLPNELKKAKYYRPTDNGYEQIIRETQKIRKK
ncbi:MAG: replication-associated recombination protein A [Selenomonadales bacterium]|nr:replication-associated recombination protein A [Selenomonadales bacterium]